MSKFGIGKRKELAVVKSITESVHNLPDAELFSEAPYDPENAERGGYSNYSYWRSTLGMFIKNRAALILTLIMAALILFSLIQPLLPGQRDPNEIVINEETGLQYRNVKPGNLFILGSNGIGQDMWARVWSGTRTSLFIGFSVALVEVLIGITVGALWGYVRKLDRIITEIYNVLNNIPTTIVLVLFTYILKPSLSTMIIAMCVTGWIGMARFIRNQIVIIRDREYNLASRCLGTSTFRIITKNLLPYLVSVIMMRMALAIPGAIGNEVFLTYIGLGLPIDIPSLGNLVNESREFARLTSLRYQLLAPLAVVSVISISFYVMGNAFADAADPKNHV